MFLKTFRGRILFLFSATLILAMSTVIVIAYLFLHQTLVEEDREYQQQRLLEYWAIYRSGGIDLVRRELSMERLASEERLFLMRIADERGAGLYLYLPLIWQNVDISRLASPKTAADGVLMKLPLPASTGELEVLSIFLHDGNILQLGISNSRRVSLLQSFGIAGLTAAFVLSAVGIGLGMVISRAMIRPLKELGQRIRGIQLSDPGGDELPVSGTGDEIDFLSIQFNEMGARIHSLVKGLRQGMDNIAHDLQTPMTRLMNRIELTLSESPVDSSAQTEALEYCLEQAKHMNSILRNIVAVTRAESGAMYPSRTNTDLDALLKDLCDLYSYSTDNNTERIRYQGPREELRIEADPDAIRQAVANLLDNAIKYSPENSIVLLRLEKNVNEAVISLKDTGVGIRAEDLPHIWERMFRADRSRSRPGLGLGLSLVRAIVLAHNGSVHVDSEPGTGSVFTLRLPIRLPLREY